jgi:hypothetical protein
MHTISPSLQAIVVGNAVPTFEKMSPKPAENSSIQRALAAIDQLLAEVEGCAVSERAPAGLERPERADQGGGAIGLPGGLDPR